MNITPEIAQEYARLLPDDLRCDNARERLLCVAEILKSLSDTDHRLSNADIRLVLAARFGKRATPAENTLNADIGALRSMPALGYTFYTSPSGSWCEGGALTPARVRLLFNAVQSSRFLAPEESADLQEALLGMVSFHQEYHLMGDVHVVQRMEAEGRAAVLDACDAIAEALRKERKVEFEYTYNDFDGTQVALPSDSGDTLRVETPIALFFSDGNYYLESYSETPWRHDQHVTRSRIDRMRFARMSNEPADLCEEVAEAKRTAARRMRRSVQMFGGAARTIFLRVGAERTNEVFDLFGFGLEFAGYRGKPGSKHATADTCVTIAQSPTFFRWLAGMRGQVRIVAPPDALTVKAQPWAHLCGGKDHADLVADYEAMTGAYQTFLQDALDACNT